VIDLGGSPLRMLCEFLIFIDNELWNGLFQNCYSDSENSSEIAHSATHCQRNNNCEISSSETVIGIRRTIMKQPIPQLFLVDNELQNIQNKLSK